MLALLLLQAAPQMPPVTIPNPTPEALALGRRLAETGTLATLLPMIAAKETDDLVAAHPELPAAEQAELRATAAATMAAGRERLFAAEGRGFAQRLTPAELRALVAFETSPAAARRRAVMPAVIAGVMTTIGAIDFKHDAWTAFCARPGRRC